MIYGNLPKDITRLWSEHRSETEDRICGWIKDIKENIGFISRARREFYKSKPLKVYINVTNAKKRGSAVFSLRFKGQEVALIVVNKNLDVQLRINEIHSELNSQYFGWKGKPFRAKWDSQQARRFRGFFREISEGKRMVKLHSPEHEVESHLLGEMKKKLKSKKFGGKFSGIQPVMFRGCPFQVPTPISGNTGIPYISKRGGNMDIVARRRVKGNKIRISDWELKKPGISGSDISKAMKQVIIYACTLRMMLRSRCAEDWYKLFGFTKGVPRRLEIEAVVALSSRDRNSYERQIKKSSLDTPLSIDGDLIIPCVAFYDDKYDVVHFEETYQ